VLVQYAATTGDWDRRAAEQAHQKYVVHESQEIPERIGPSVGLDAQVTSSGANEFMI
jgi:hypothetical protein